MQDAHNLRTDLQLCPQYTDICGGRIFFQYGFPGTLYSQVLAVRHPPDQRLYLAAEKQFFQKQETCGGQPYKKQNVAETERLTRCGHRGDHHVPNDRDDSAVRYGPGEGKFHRKKCPYQNGHAKRDQAVGAYVFQAVPAGQKRQQDGQQDTEGKGDGEYGHKRKIQEDFPLCFARYSLVNASSSSRRASFSSGSLICTRALSMVLTPDFRNRRRSSSSI